jgi:hypothetical protein
MSKKYPKSEAVQNTVNKDEPAFIAWGNDDASRTDAMNKSAESLSEYTAIDKTIASRRYSLDYSNLDTNTSGRPGMTRSDYYYFRPGEAVPLRIKHIIQKADDIYQRVGLVKNVIDLMGDFACQGVRLVHKNKRIERFYRQWFKKVRGKDRSERFLNNLYKTGNVIINRQTGKLSLKVAEALYKAVASPDLNIQNLDNINVEKREIPWIYTLMDPVVVEVAAGPLASFSQQKLYEIILPASLRKSINSPKTDLEKQIVDSLPIAMIQAAKTKLGYPLDPEKTIVYHYKKDDWQSWAFPMIYAIMDDITVLEKLKLADMSALDGAISNIRIFKLGSLEHKIAPTKAAAAKLAQILGNNVGGGTMDLVWGPDIELIESKTSVHQFLGEGKYIPHLNSVYAGLGIPPTLTGTYGAAGTTNNFISLKTLTQRLQYGRDVLTDFWEKEIAIVQKAMGFRYPARVEFDRMDLSNEDAEKALLIQLADRNLISDELLQSRFGVDPDMEKSRLNRESRDRKSERMVRKAGPWYDPQLENALKKIALQGGSVSPSQVGLELEKKKGGEKNALELKQELAIPKIPIGAPSPVGQPKIDNKLPGQPGQGRPKNSKDTEPRKTKKFAPQTGAKLNLWALATQDNISNIINPIILEYFNKKNLRSLSNEEIKELDKIKTKIFFDLNPFDSIDQNFIISKITSNNDPNILEVINQYSVWLNQLKAEINRDLSVEEVKQAKASFYVALNSQEV